MKEKYIKTNWVDDKTPVDAVRLNKIEDGIETLYEQVPEKSEIVAGTNISVTETSLGEVVISTTSNVLTTSDVINSLESTEISKPLSANKGKELSEVKANKVTSAVQGDIAVLSSTGDLVDSGILPNTLATKTELAAETAARIAGDIALDKIFTAIYGTTTYQQLNSEYTSGKICILKHSNGYAVLSQFDSTNSIYYFASVTDNTNLYSIDSNNVWNTQLLNTEYQSNKVSEFSANPTDINYPSEKLVKNSLDTKADKATTLAGYGITDAKIENGVITLGPNTIIPVTDVSDKEDKSNKVTAFSETVTDIHYPSEKLVKDSLDTKADKATTLAGYNISDAYTKTEIDTKLDTKSDKATTLSGYGITDAYTKSEVNTQLDTKADKATTLEGYNISDAYTKTEVDTKLAVKADKATTLAGYEIGDAKIENQKITLGTNSIDVLVASDIEGKVNKTDSLSANDTDKGVKVTLGGSVETPTLNVEVTEGSISTGNNSVITGGTVYNVTSDLQSQINNLKGIGRFLSTWNAVTGKPGDDPTTTPYTYKVGDYYIVGNIAASGGTNYRPAPVLQYDKTASTVEESDEILIGDYYFCSKVETETTTWTLLKSSRKTVTFSDIAGAVKDNTALKNAFETADAADSSDSGVKVSLTGTVENHGITVEVTPGSIASGNTSVVTGGDVYTSLQDKADKATTLAGYNISDAKIVDGVITLGENTITPLTEHQDISGKEDKSNKVTSWTETTSNDKYPSEKLVKDSLDEKADKSTTLAGYNISDAYTKSEVDTQLDGKADKATTLAGYEIGDAYTKTEIDTALSGKANKATTLEGYNISDAYTKSEVDTQLNGKADKSTTLAGYGIGDAYTRSEVDTQLSGKANVADSLSGYGINDAKIVDGVITLGSNSITPLTSHQDISGKEDKSNKINNLTSPNETTYPTTKAVSDGLSSKQDTLTAGTGITISNNVISATGSVAGLWSTSSGITTTLVPTYGNNNSSTSEHSTILSGGANLIGNDSDGAVLYGQNNNCSGGGISETLVGGGSNVVSSTQSSIISGDGNRVSNSHFSIVGGKDNHLTTSERCLIAGSGNTIEKGSASTNNLVSATFGENNTNSGSIRSLMCGGGNSCTGGENNFVIGLNNTVSNSSHSIVSGDGLSISNQNGAAVFGKYNYDLPSASIVLGVGSDSDNKKNAAYVRNDGKFYLFGVGNYQGGEVTDTQDLATVISGKVTAESGKGLSTNDYTTAEKEKLTNIAEGAEVNVQSNWNETDITSDAYILNKPNVPAGFSVLTEITTTGTNSQTIGAKALYDKFDEKVDKLYEGTEGNLVKIGTNGTIIDSEKAFSDIQLTANLETELSTNTDKYPSSSLLKSNIDRLDGRIDNISSIGRFLSTWSCVSGKPDTEPASKPYIYKSGDYYIISVISQETPAVNYKPDGSSYTGDASEVVTTDSVHPNDIYKFDGSQWVFYKIDTRIISWGSITGTLSNQTDLSTALGEKESASNKITSWNTASDTNYPSAKLVNDTKMDKLASSSVLLCNNSGNAGNSEIGYINTSTISGICSGGSSEGPTTLAGKNQIAFGDGVVPSSSTSGSVAFGQFTDSSITDAVFTIGTGTSETRKDAFIVQENDDIYIRYNGQYKKLQSAIDDIVALQNKKLYKHRITCQAKEYVTGYSERQDTYSCQWEYYSYQSEHGIMEIADIMAQMGGIDVDTWGVYDVNCGVQEPGYVGHSRSGKGYYSKESGAFQFKFYTSNNVLVPIGVDTSEIQRILIFTNDIWDVI